MAAKNLRFTPKVPSTALRYDPFFFQDPPRAYYTMKITNKAAPPKTLLTPSTTPPGSVVRHFPSESLYLVTSFHDEDGVRVAFNLETGAPLFLYDGTYSLLELVPTAEVVVR